MASGRTLPCFAPYDAGARSCGFIGDRFLTGAPSDVEALPKYYQDASSSTTDFHCEVSALAWRISYD